MTWLKFVLVETTCPRGARNTFVACAPRCSDIAVSYSLLANGSQTHALCGFDLVLNMIVFLQASRLLPNNLLQFAQRTGTT